MSSHNQLKKTISNSSESNDSQVKILKRQVSNLKQQFQQVKKEQVEYLQNVSHQLISPLNAIKWHIENLTAGRVNYERGMKVLRSIYSQATIAVHLAKNFALMSNLEADHKLTALREPPEEIKLIRLMVNLADDFQPLAWDKNVKIKVIDNPLNSAPNVFAIKNLISQTYSNIIENAVKYSTKESIIKIDGQYNAENDTVSVRITSKGISLPADETKNIFSRGHRGKEAINLYPAGTGFGLFIAKKIVEIHEGTIIAHTDELGQVVFTVNLPVKKLDVK